MGLSINKIAMTPHAPKDVDLVYLLLEAGLALDRPPILVIIAK